MKVSSRRPSPAVAISCGEMIEMIGGLVAAGSLGISSDPGDTISQRQSDPDPTRAPKRAGALERGLNIVGVKAAGADGDWYLTSVQGRGAR